MKLFKQSSLMAITLALVVVSTNATAQKLYKWVDSDGNISYQDQPPPANAKVLDEKSVGEAAGFTDNDASNNNTTPVRIYTVGDCAVCARSVLLLLQSGVPHIELPLNTDREAQSAILEKTSSLIAPSIMIGDKILQAPSNGELTEALIAAGYAIAE